MEKAQHFTNSHNCALYTKERPKLSTWTVIKAVCGECIKAERGCVCVYTTMPLLVLTCNGSSYNWDVSSCLPQWCLFFRRGWPLFYPENSRYAGQRKKTL